MVRSRPRYTYASYWLRRRYRDLGEAMEVGECVDLDGQVSMFRGTEVSASAPGVPILCFVLMLMGDGV